jgi:hypothetical protein
MPISIIINHLFPRASSFYNSFKIVCGEGTNFERQYFKSSRSNDALEFSRYRLKETRSITSRIFNGLNIAKLVPTTAAEFGFIAHVPAIQHISSVLLPIGMVLSVLSACIEITSLARDVIFRKKFCRFDATTSVHEFNQRLPFRSDRQKEASFFKLRRWVGKRCAKSIQTAQANNILGKEHFDYMARQNIKRICLHTLGLVIALCFLTVTIIGLHPLAFVFLSIATSLGIAMPFLSKSWLENEGWHVSLYLLLEMFTPSNTRTMRIHLNIAKAKRVLTRTLSHFKNRLVA